MSKSGFISGLFLLATMSVMSQNYIKTTVYCSPGNDESNAMVSTVYYDGLGRERLSVSECAGGDGNPVAVMTEYDLRGNLGKKWLPVPDIVDGNNYSAFIKKSLSFYGSSEIPYSEYKYEENGMNRLTDENGPGLNWKGHGQKIGHDKNQSTGQYACKQFSCAENISLPMDAGVAPKSLVSVKGSYPPGTLSVETVTDGDGKKSMTFKDRLDRVILQRLVSTDGKTADIYFIYDIAGDLVYALSPEGSALLPSSGNVSQTILNDYAQAFTYDIYHRCITAKAPGCEPTHYVYDKLNRVVLESTATQRAEGTWTLTKYDSQFRPAIKGLVALPGKTRESLQTQYGNSTIVEDPDYNFNFLESKLGYPGSAGPSGFQPYIAWFYDNYEFIVGPNAKEKSAFVTSGDKYTQQGMCTGMITKTDINSDAYVQAIKYDHKGNIVRTCRWDINLQNFMKTDEFVYDFVGNLVSHTEKYESIVDGSFVTEQHIAVTENTYDVNGRLLTSEVSVDGATPFVVQNLVYDSIGRLVRNLSGPEVGFAYDIRSNLTDITSNVFSQKTWFGQTPTQGADVSYLYANGSRLTWADNKSHTEYSHTEAYRYDGFGHFSKMTSDNNQVYEKMDANLNADVREIVRTYRGDIIQDAVMQFDGCRLTEVHDASSPYWADAVASFSMGDYTLEYDSDGRLIKDGTRDITSITYQSFGNLPKRMQTTDGSYMTSTYFSDGTLKSRTMSTRTIEVVTKIDSDGNIVSSEREKNTTSTRQYWGNFERNTDGWVYHTPAGFYSVKDGQHYWYVRDRLGSTVAVTDKDGNLLQATGYYPSGTPYELPNSVLATEIDAKTDQLHIGNRWIGHKGLDLYDNTARMHDPLLARFHTVDPLFTDYPGQSPWSHCAANPINFIDPSGMDVWQLDDRGYFTLEKNTKDEYDTILGRDGASIQVEKGFMESVLNFDGEEESTKLRYEVSLYKLYENGRELFEFLADNSDVEWSRAKLITGVNYIGTSHDTAVDGSIDVLQQKLPEEFKLIYIFDHNHPNGSTGGSAADSYLANRFSENEYPVIFRVYTTQEKYIPNKLYLPLSLHYTPYYPK